MSKEYGGTTAVIKVSNLPVKAYVNLYDDAVARGEFSGTFEAFLATLKVPMTIGGVETLSPGEPGYVKGELVDGEYKVTYGLPTAKGEKGDPGPVPEFEKTVLTSVVDASDVGAELSETEAGRLQLKLRLPAPKDGQDGRAFEFADEGIVVEYVDAGAGEHFWEKNEAGQYILHLKHPIPAAGKSAYEQAVAAGFSGSVDEWLTSLRGAEGAVTLSGVPFFKSYTGYTLADLLSTGIFYLTNATAIRRLGLPGGIAGKLTVMYLSASHIFFEWTTISGIYATNYCLNSTWQGWQIINMPALQAAPEYPRDAIVTLGSSSMALLSSFLHTEMTTTTRNGFACINKASDGKTAAFGAACTDANVIRIQFPGGVIPATGGSVAVNIEQTYAFNMNGQYIELQTGAAGQILGSPGSYTWKTHTRVAIPEALQVESDAWQQARMYTYAGWEQGIVVISMGKNDISTYGDMTSIKAAFAATIDALKPTGRARYLVVNQFGNFDYNENQLAAVKELNEWQRRRYGARYYDLNAYLMSEQVWIDAALTATETDLAAQAAGKLAPTLSRDGGKHLSDAVNKIVAVKVADKLKALNYI